MKNKNVVYSGKVGANMKPLSQRGKSTAKGTSPMHCADGPMKGETLWVSDRTTAFFTLGDQTGRYVDSVWHPI